jgi:uncharacterized protein (DUF1778 family)
VVYHVAPADKGGWVIHQSGARRESAHFETKREALARAREIVRESSSELVIHARDGRIAEADTFSSAATGKSVRIDVRTTPVVKALLRRAAASSHKNVTEFLLEAGINAAEEALADRRLFRLDDEQWEAFNAALDRPVAAKPRLARLLSEKSVLE